MVFYLRKNNIFWNFIVRACLNTDSKKYNLKNTLGYIFCPKKKIKFKE